MEVNWRQFYLVYTLLMKVCLSKGLQLLAKGNNQGHDQGFLAIPYFEELRM
jgi:hypothetical protein